MFTKKEIYEYLAKYPQDTIPDVLKQLGYDDRIEEYPDDVVEKAENIYEAMGVAANMQKKLSESMSSQESLSSEIIATQVSAIASTLLESQGINLPPSAVMVLAQATVVQTVELVDKLALLQERTWNARTEQHQKRFTEKVLNSVRASAIPREEVLSDEAQYEFIEAAIPALPSAQDAVQVFLSEIDAKQKANRQISGERDRQQAALDKPKVDVKAFLAARRV